MTSYLDPSAPAHHPDGVLRALVPVPPVLPAARRPGEAASPAAATASPDPGVVERVEERYGFDDPIPEQFVNYWKRTLQWDLGESFRNRPQRQRDPRRAGRQQPPPGHLGDPHRDHRRHQRRACSRRSADTRSADRLTTIVTAAASAIPVFVLGFLLQYVFAVYPNKHDWPEWARLRTSGLGPDTWTLFFIPTGEQWRYLHPAGRHPRRRCPPRSRPA